MVTYAGRTLLEAIKEYRETPASEFPSGTKSLVDLKAAYKRGEIPRRGESYGGCPPGYWIVHYFDADTRTWKEMMVKATLSTEAVSQVKGLTNGSLYSADKEGDIPGYDYSRATPYEALDTTGKYQWGEPVELPSNYTPTQQAEYAAYVNDVNSGLYPNLPPVDSIERYFKIADQIEANGYYYFNTTEGTLEQWETWQQVQAYGSKYGNLEDYRPANWAELVTNYDQALQQLEAWKTEAGPEAVGFTDDQIRDWNTYTQYYNKYAELGDPKPVDIGDFIANFNDYQRQLIDWQKQEGAEKDYERDWLTFQQYSKYAGPTDQIPTDIQDFIADYDIYQRQMINWQKEAQVIEQERYKETPEYAPPFTKWIQEQEGFSGALEKFIEGRYSSLRSEFQATQPRLTGYPTLGEARTEAERREQAWVGWLGEKTPELEQKYWAQRPAERGEKLWAYSPATKTLNW